MTIKDLIKSNIFIQVYTIRCNNIDFQVNHYIFNILNERFYLNAIKKNSESQLVCNAKIYECEKYIYSKGFPFTWDSYTNSPSISGHVTFSEVD